MSPQDVTGRRLSKLAALAAVEEHLEVDKARGSGAAVGLYSERCEGEGLSAATQRGFLQIKISFIDL